jgi:hypothetical protein
LAGTFGLMPAFLTGLAVYLAMAAVVGPRPEGVSSVAGAINVLTLSGVVLSILMIVIMGAFAFVPFYSRSGRKYSPTLLMIVVQCGIVAAAVGFFWMLQISLSQIGLPMF